MRNAALINGGDETGEIANDPAAQPDDKGVPIEAGLNHFITDQAGLFERFGAFASRNGDERGPNSFAIETSLQRFREKGSDLSVGNERARFFPENTGNGGGGFA